MREPLAGVTVVEVSTFLTGPLAALSLADMGASVIKVEPPGGDPMRRFGRCVNGLSLQWLAANRGKETEEVDLAVGAGRARLSALLDTADVLITNWRPGVAQRLGLEPDDVADRWPALVWCRISGFGQDGPRATAPAFDTVIQAASGLMATQGDPGRPQLVRGFVADKITATYAAQAILAALVDLRGAAAEHVSRRRGVLVDVAMLDALSYFDFPDLMAERTLPTDGPRRADGGAPDGINHQLRAVVPLPTADGWIVLAPVRFRQLTASFAVVGHPEWALQLAAQEDPVGVTATFYDLMATVTPTRPTEPWITAFAAADVPAAEVLGPDGHLADPQVLHNGVYTEADSPPVGRHRVCRHPARWG